jgi:dihydropteroate synthase
MVAQSGTAAYNQPMRALLRHKFLWCFLGLLVFCSVMVIRRLDDRHSQHTELREAFILLHSKGYTNQAQRLFERLSRNLTARSTESLSDDFQRTLFLVDPARPQPNNVLWKYHWLVSQEMERRSQGTLAQALRLSEKVE